MGQLRLAVLGTPEVYHDGNRLTFSLRKALALLLYLAVDGDMHLRSKLAAFLWPDSEPHDARTALRNSIALLRSLLEDPSASPAPHPHVLSQRDLLGLNPLALLELDLDIVQHAYQQAQVLSASPSPEQRATLVAHLQRALALVRGPFLDGFWLREEAPFDEWHQQQQHHWQVRLHWLFDRLSSLHEAAGEHEQAMATLTRWLALDPLTEEIYRRLMRVQLAQGELSSALQVYASCRVRLAEELQVKPSAETIALAEHIRATQARQRRNAPARTGKVPAQSRPPSELAAPLVGRAAAFSQLVGSFQQACQGEPQAVLVVGEAGMGKTRLAREFVAWAQAQGAEVLCGSAFEMGGRLPYQPLVEAIRPRLEEENAPEDLLEDVWLAELSRILPELRVRYPDLGLATEEELTAKVRLFEAVARLFARLAQGGPLVLFVDDLHWVDGASLDLVRYLARSWKEQSLRIVLLATVGSERLKLHAALAAGLADLGRELPVRQVVLQALSRRETIQLIGAVVGGSEAGSRSEAASEAGAAGPGSVSEPPLVALGNYLYAHTGGQPFYLLETLKKLREREWLVPRLVTDGSWKLEPAVHMVAALAQEQTRRELLPSSVRAMILARLSQLSRAARQVVMASAVLGTQASALHLWQVTEVGVQVGVEALEEAVGSGLLREEEAGGGQGSSYGFAHELIREVVYNELSEARRRVLHQRALGLAQREGARVSELAYHALAAGEGEAAYRYSVQAGDEAMAVFAVQDAIVHYEHGRTLLHERVQQAMLELFQSKSLPSITVQEIAERARVDRGSYPEVEHLYVSLGRGYAYLNAWEQAQEAYEELLAYAQHHHLPGLVSMTLNRLAILAVQQSYDKQQVSTLLEKAWEIAQASQDEKALAETEWNQAQVAAILGEDPTRAFPLGEHALSLARASNDKELEARSLSSLGYIHLNVGDFVEAMRSLEGALALYAELGSEPSASGELSVPSFILGAPPTQPLTNRAAEAVCWGLLAQAQVHDGQVHHSLRSGHMALALAKEIKNVWVQVNSTLCLTYSLLEGGAYEEALVLMQQAVALARSLPLRVNFQGVLIGLGSVYHALQQWEEARRTLEEAEAVAERLELGLVRVAALSQLCMNCAQAGEWEAAFRYAMKAMALRRSHEVKLIALDFYSQYETEALLRGGEERQARAEVQRLGNRLGSYRRFRIPYLRSRAMLAAWDGHSEQVIEHLREAAGLAADIGVPAEGWQIQAMLGRLYAAGGEAEQAGAAWAAAATLIGGLAEGIGNETLRTRFLAAPQIQQVLQQAQGETSPIRKDHAEQSGR